MAIVKIIKNDLIQLFKKGYFQVIGHGANCKNLMGAGIARQIQSELPEAFKADCEFYTRMGGVDNKPCHGMGGKISTASVEVGDYTGKQETKIGRVVNMYTQVQTGAHASYQLLQSACERLNKYCKERSITRVGLPLVGGGIGGLDPIAAMTIISMATPDVDVTLVIWKDDDNLFKKVTKHFKNYGFPRVFDHLVMRTGQTQWQYYDVDTKEWKQFVYPIEDTKSLWDKGEFAITYSDFTPAISLLVGKEEDVEENLHRLVK